MSRFALQVTLQLEPGSADQFRPHILRAAEAAVRLEPDCHHFHVAQSEDDPDTFVLFEIYTDASALELHHQQPHFLQFGKDAGHMVREKTRLRLRLE